MTTQKRKPRARAGKFPLPPAGFDYLTADDATLRSYGLIPPSDLHPEIAATLREVLSTPTTYVQRQFSRRKRRGPSPLERTRSSEFASNNWSGLWVTAPPGKTIDAVTGIWTVPDIAPSAPGLTLCTIWIGIDGSSGKNLFQSGIDCRVTSNDGDNQFQLSPWWEWLPDDEKTIDNMAISAGHQIYCLLKASSPASGTYFFKNMNNGMTASFPVSAPPGTTLARTRAEWIVEAPVIQNNPTTLCRYGAVTFTNCFVSTTDGDTLNLSAGTLIELQRNQQTLSSAQLTGPNQVTCTYAGA